MMGFTACLRQLLLGVLPAAGEGALNLSRPCDICKTSSDRENQLPTALSARVKPVLPMLRCGHSVGGRSPPAAVRPVIAFV